MHRESPATTPDLDWGEETTTTPTPDDTQRRLQDLAERTGVPLNMLTQEAVIQWSNAWHQAAGQINREIAFYGRVVDENEQPLAGVTVEFGCHEFPERFFATNVVSDAGGLFALTSITGATLNVFVGKAGYQQAEGLNQNRFDYYSPGGAGFRPDSNNPVIFRLRKTDP